MRRFISLVSSSVLLLSAMVGCATAHPIAPAAAPATITAADVDTSDPSFNPPQDGFVMVEKPTTKTAATSETNKPTAVAMPTPNARAASADKVHAATN